MLMISLHLNLDSFTQVSDSQTVNASRVTIDLPARVRRTLAKRGESIRWAVTV